MRIELPLIAFFLLLPGAALAEDRVVADSLNIGFLIPLSGTHGLGERMAAGIPIGLEAAQKLLPNARLNWAVIDSGCLQSNVIDAAVRLLGVFSSRMNVVFGELCSEGCEVVSFAAETVNVPFLSFGCISDRLGDRSVYRVFARSVPPASAFTPVIRAIFKQFDWQNMPIVITTSERAFQKLAKLIVREFHLKSPTSSERLPRIPLLEKISHLYPNDSRYTDAKNSFEEEVKTRIASRVFILLMNSQEVLCYLEIARAVGLYDGQYAFMTVEYDINPSSKNLSYPCIRKADVIKLHEGLIVVSLENLPRIVSKDMLQQFNSALQHPKFKEEPRFQGITIESNDSFSIRHIGNVYDAILMWAHEMAKPGSFQISSQDGGARLIIQGILSAPSLPGLFSDITVDKGGERVPGGFDVCMFQKGNLLRIMWISPGAVVTNRLVNYEELTWASGKTGVPIDRHDITNDYGFIIGFSTAAACFTLGIIVVVIICLVRKHNRNRKTIKNWIIPWNDITIVGNTLGTSNANLNAVVTAKVSSEVNSVHNMCALRGATSQTFIVAGVCKGVLVAIKKINRESVDPYSQEISEELRQMLNIKHENVNEFVGVCCEAPNVCVLMAYADKGSLQDVIFNETVTFSDDLRISLVTDIVKGMDYLHSSEIGAHGKLSSSNCVVSRHWRVKVTDYGLWAFKMADASDVNSYQKALNLMWCAPELLRKELYDPDRFYGTKEGDVYSFGIIVSELLTCDAPYRDALVNFTPADIIYRVRRSQQPPFRPVLSNLMNVDSPKWTELAEICWREEPRKRPTFYSLKDFMKSMAGGKYVNILDLLYQTLEKSLESKTTQLIEEKANVQRLMYSMFPKSVADVLIEGGECDPQMSNPVTVAFMDLIGMSKLVSTLTPTQISEAITGLCRRFDAIIRLYTVHKVGIDVSCEGTMIVSGIPERSVTHASDMCTLSLHLLSTLLLSNVENLELQIGISSGPVIAFIIGKIVPRYRIFGRAVEQCLSIQAASQVKMIRVSKSVVDNLAEEDNDFETKSAGYVKVQEEKVDTMWLMHKRGFDLALPTTNDLLEAFPRSSTHRTDV